MESYKASVPTVGELIAEDDMRGKRALVQVAAGALIAVGLVFTGYLNYALYSRAFPDELRILGVIPALLIEGSLAVFLLGNFVWFAAGTQGTLGRVFGWAMFAIVGANTLIEFNALTGQGSNEFVRLYAYWGVPIVIPMVIAFWKAILDADPAIQVMRQRQRIAQSLHLAQLQAIMQALDTETSRKAVQAYGERYAAAIQRRLRGLETQDAEISVNGHDPKA